MRFVRLAAARAHNQRAGMRWPNREITTALVARATDALDRVEFEDAWQAGSRLTLDDLDDLDVAVVERAPMRPGSPQLEWVGPALERAARSSMRAPSAGEAPT